MTSLITVIVAMATTLVGLALAIAKGDAFKHAPGWIVPALFGISGGLYLLAIAIAVNNARRDHRAKANEERNQIKARLAPLIKQQHEIYARLKAASDDSEYTELIRKAVTWVDNVASLLREIEPTDAEIFSHAGHSELSAEQLGRVSHVPPWKRAEVARFLLCIQTLDQIRSNRRL